MKTSRPFAWDDVAPLHELVKRRWSVDGPRGQRRIGDFWWALRNTPAGEPLRHMHAWRRDDSSLAAVAWLDPPATGDVIVAPDAAAMFDGALDWLEAEHRAAGAGALAIVVLAGDGERADALGRRGYAPGEGGNVRLSQALTAAPGAVPPADGVSLREVATALDMERRAFVESDSFGGSVTGDAWRSITQRLPGYRADLDIVAVAADGAGASACTCFYDGATRCGEFEAVGTAKAFRRRGVGKAVITEGLRRLHERGAARAIVETTIGNTAAIALYQSCGFAEVARDYGWTKRG